MNNHCIASGMPMTSADDFAIGDSGKDYCTHCTRPDATMKSNSEVLEGMTAFLVRIQGIGRDAAANIASDMMSKLPAWKCSLPLRRESRPRCDPRHRGLSGLDRSTFVARYEAQSRFGERRQFICKPMHAKSPGRSDRVDEIPTARTIGARVADHGLLRTSERILKHTEVVKVY